MRRYRASIEFRAACGLNSTLKPAMVSRVSVFFFALLCAGCAVSSVRSASDDYLEITRRNGWGVLVSERLLKSINSDPDLPQI